MLLDGLISGFRGPGKHRQHSRYAAIAETNRHPCDRSRLDPPMDGCKTVTECLADEDAMLLDADPARAFLPYPAVPVPHASSGPLSGVTFAVKDLLDVAGY